MLERRHFFRSCTINLWCDYRVNWLTMTRQFTARAAAFSFTSWYIMNYTLSVSQMSSQDAILYLTPSVKICSWQLHNTLTLGSLTLWQQREFQRAHYFGFSKQLRTTYIPKVTHIHRSTIYDLIYTFYSKTAHNHLIYIRMVIKSYIPAPK